MWSIVDFVKFVIDVSGIIGYDDWEKVFDYMFWHLENSIDLRASFFNISALAITFRITNDWFLDSTG